MCICINCRHVNSCNIYKVIQRQHKQKIKPSTVSFIPKDTLIDINIHQAINSVRLDWDLVECLSFVEQPGQWLKNFSN